MNYSAEYKYITVGETKLFTAILKPDKEGKFPTVIIRSPYVDEYEDFEENDILAIYISEFRNWLKNGYAVVVQHCRGRGKSEGDCIPYINEREDGLILQDWIRSRDFYNGELFLKGRSYLTSVHYATAPFQSDIKGAVFSVQDCERYNICYRNGFLKKMLHCNWYVGMYKAKSGIKKNYTINSFDMLPLADFTKTVFGKSADDFDKMLKAPDRENEFWNTRFGGSDARDAVKNVDFPVLLTTGFYDIYTGGIFDMWNGMSNKTRQMSALVVSPYDHKDNFNEQNAIKFNNGRLREQFGEDYEIEWFNHIRDNSVKNPFEKGKVTYYRLFENRWARDSFNYTKDAIKSVLGNDDCSYVYNPYDAPGFKGGLSTNFGGSEFQDKPGWRHDVITVYTKRFQSDVFVKGKMSAKLCVISDCEDTCFYMRISIEKEQGDFGLRDDITSLCFGGKSYTPGEEAVLDFEFDEHAFFIKKGERLRIDIASADNNHYVRHTNNKGLYSEMTTAKIAKNTVRLHKSYLSIPTGE